MRRPFVPAALVAGAVAPDVPYFLGVLVSRTSSQDWYEPLLNPTQTHAFDSGMLLCLPFALGLVAAWRMLRAPVTALLPRGIGLPEPERTPGLPGRARYAAWLLVSALIGIASHLVWDSFTHGHGFLVNDLELLRTPILGGLTGARILQYASTVIGLAAVARHLWRHRGHLRAHGDTDTVARLGPITRWSVVSLLVAAPLLGGAVNAHDDFNAYRTTTEEDYSQPATVVNDGVTESTTYPSRTVEAPWGTVAEGVLTGVAKRAGTSFTIALLLYSATWQIGSVTRRSAGAGLAPSQPPTRGGG